MKTMETQVPDAASESFFCPLGTELIIRFEGNDAQYKSSLIGLDKGSSLIIKVPRTAEIEPSGLVDKSLKAIFLHDGTIFGFVSKVMSSVISPSQLFFISYPEIMQRHELRKDLRMDCSIPAIIRQENKPELPGVITNLSSGGCRVTIPKSQERPGRFEIDSALEMYSDMLGIECDKPIRGVIKNLSQDEKRTHLGFQFETTDAGVLERIQVYVSRVLNVVY